MTPGSRTGQRRGISTNRLTLDVVRLSPRLLAGGFLSADVATSDVTHTGLFLDTSVIV